MAWEQNYLTYDNLVVHVVPRFTISVSSQKQKIKFWVKNAIFKPFVKLLNLSLNTNISRVMGHLVQQLHVTPHHLGSEVI